MYKNVNFYFLVLVFGLSVQIANAQSNFTTGLRAGLGLTDLKGDNIQDTQSAVAFNGGLFASYPLSPILSLQSEVNLVFKGAKEANINNFPFSKASISYIQVPVLIKVNAVNEWIKDVKPFLFAGPAMNVNITKDLEGEILPDVPGAFSVDQKVKSFNYDVLMGIGTTIDDTYLVDLRYSYGFSDIFEQGDTKSQGITLSVGFIF